MDPPSHLLTSFTICVLLFLSSPSQADDESPSLENSSSKLVISVCKETLNPSECEETLATIPKARTVRTLNALAHLTLRLAVSYAKESLDFVNEMVKTNTSEPIKQCAFWYREVLASFQSALGELHEDISSANYDIKVAGDNSDSCEEGLAKLPVPSLTARNAQIKLYSSIGFVITSRMDV
ncbi:uncharacterized protein LOC125422953 [Ziziphus jujuba]|uniref:Uncharacterized protein LOC125422953 n=2 Tax=Ziziphus jujuba TaxID=326968 RepID=A0ABM3IMH7_ZIZJJ|nr:uncharacterized protein LOC125422953 [Ziziphus jujuba]KAH7524973.1 hypothetical protein FEM48_Zijuj06G0176000 [Ziziphus jujuba var. spinosa]